MSVGIAFIIFIVIIVYHVFQFDIVQKNVQKLRKAYKERMSKYNTSALSKSEIDTSIQSDSEGLMSKFPPLARFDQEREPLLFDVD